MSSRQASGWAASQVLNACSERPSAIANSRDGPVPVLTGGEVDDDGDVICRPCVFVALACVTPGVFVDADDRHAIQAAGLVGEQALAFGQDRVVGGAPRDAEGGGDPAHGQAIDHQGFQRPPQHTARQTGTRLRRAREVLAPNTPATGAHRQRRSRTRRMVERQPDGTRANSRGTLPRGCPWQPQRWHQPSDSTGRHSRVARSRLRCRPATTRPRPPRRQNVARPAGM